MGSVGTITSRAAAITIFIVHGTKHRTIDPGCLENPRPEGAEPGERCFSIFFSSPDNLSCGKRWETRPSPAQASNLSTRNNAKTREKPEGGTGRNARNN